MSKIIAELIDLVTSKPTLSRKDLQRFFGRAPRTISRWHALGVLPAAHYLPGCASPFWTAAQILAHVRNRPTPSQVKRYPKKRGLSIRRGKGPKSAR